MELREQKKKWVIVQNQPIEAPQIKSKVICYSDWKAKFRQSQRTPNEIYLLLNNTNSIAVEQSIYFGYKMLDNKWINEINQFPCSLNTEFRGSALVYSASFDWFDFIYRYPLSTDIRTREKKKWKNEMVKIHKYGFMISISSRCCKYLFNVQMYFCFFCYFYLLRANWNFIDNIISQFTEIWTVSIDVRIEFQ